MVAISLFQNRCLSLLSNVGVGRWGGGGEEYVAIQDQKELHLIFFLKIQQR